MLKLVWVLYSNEGLVSGGLLRSDKAVYYIGQDETEAWLAMYQLDEYYTAGKAA